MKSEKKISISECKSQGSMSSESDNSSEKIIINRRKRPVFILDKKTSKGLTSSELSDDSESIVSDSE